MKYAIVVIGALWLLCGSVQAQTRETWLQKEFRLFRVYPRLDRAQGFYQQERYLEARQLLEQTLAIDASYVQALQLLVETCNKLDDIPCIDQVARQLLNLPTGSAFGAYYLMLLAVRENDNDAAASWAEKSLSFLSSQLDDDQKYIVFTTMNQIVADNESFVDVSGYIDVEAEPETPSQPDMKVLARSWPQVVWTDLDVQPVLEQSLTSNLDINPFTQPLAGDISLESFLAATADSQDSGDDVSIEQKLVWLNVLDQAQRYEEALTIARMLPGGTATVTLQTNLLEKLYRFEDAARILEQNPTEDERRNSEYWLRLVKLYSSAGLEQRQIKVLVEALTLMPTDTQLLAVASEVFVKQVALLEDVNAAADESSILDSRLLDIQKLLAIINASNNQDIADAIPAYRIDAEISLVGNLLQSGDEDKSWALISELVQGSALSFSQASSLSESVWGMGRCRSFIEQFQDQSETLNSGAQLLLSSCFRRMGEYSQASSLLELLITQNRFSADDILQLERGLGYLYLELNEQNKAVTIWQKVLSTKFDPVLALGTSYVFILMEQWDQAESVLLEIKPDDLSEAYKGEYWRLRGSISVQNDRSLEAVSHYQQALIWDGANSDLWGQLANAAEQVGFLNTADKAWRTRLELDPDSGIRHAEFAYYLQRNGQLEEAISEFKIAVSYLQENLNLRRDLVYSQLAIGDFTNAALTLRDEILQGQTSQNFESEALVQDQRLLASIESKWSLEYTEIARMDDGVQQRVNTGLRNSSYRGYGSLVVNYLPEFARDQLNNQSLVFNARMFWSNQDQSISPENDTTVFALGARYKVLEKYAVFASAEQLFGIGAQAENDTLLRLSASFSKGLDWPYGKTAWDYKNLYLDAAYFVDTKVHYDTAEYEQGRVFKLESIMPSMGIMPFMRIGLARNNDSAFREQEVRMDAGIGVSLLGRQFYDPFLGYRTSSRISFLINGKLAGNTDDEFSAHLRFNVRL